MNAGGLYRLQVDELIVNIVLVTGFNRIYAKVEKPGRMFKRDCVSDLRIPPVLPVF